MIERTLAVIKPCATKNRFAGAIIEIIESLPGVEVVEARLTHYSVAQAEAFYAEHQGRPYYERLIAHTLSGPCWALWLEGENVVQRWRDVIGPTDPTKDIDRRTDLRAKFGTGVPDNALHGSDSQKSALREFAIMFPDLGENTEGFIDA